MDLFIVDKSLQDEKTLGFNVGSLIQSVVIESSEYFKLISPDFMEFISD